MQANTSETICGLFGIVTGIVSVYQLTINILLNNTGQNGGLVWQVVSGSVTINQSQISGYIYGGITNSIGTLLGQGNGTGAFKLNQTNYTI